MALVGPSGKREIDRFRHAAQSDNVRQCVIVLFILASLQFGLGEPGLICPLNCGYVDRATNSCITQIPATLQVAGNVK
jgi:hypothetical protein